MSGDEDPRPPFVGDSELLAEAFDYARRAHEGPASLGKTRISHPVAVAGILASAGFDEEAIAAALLHDVIEDTSHDSAADISAGFPERVGGLVAVMTEDDTIADYAERKAEHRQRVLEAGPLPASIYLADKLARVRRFTDTGQRPDPEQLEHYSRTVELFGEREPGLPFLPELDRELPHLQGS